MSVAPPRPKGSLLNALRAFEAAARMNSFSSAAPRARRIAAPAPLVDTQREPASENSLLRSLALRLAKQEAEQPI